MAAYTNSLLPAICFSFDSLLHLKAKPSWTWIGTAKNSTYPRRHQLNRRSIYLPANSLSSPKMRGTTPSPILMLSYSLAISMISQPWRVKHCALFVTMVHHQSPHLAAKLFSQGMPSWIKRWNMSVVPEFLRTLVFARPRGDDQFADCTFSPSLDMSR